MRADWLAGIDAEEIVVESVYLSDDKRYTHAVRISPLRYIHSLQDLLA